MYTAYFKITYFCGNFTFDMFAWKDIEKAYSPLKDKELRKLSTAVTQEALNDRYGHNKANVNSCYTEYTLITQKEYLSGFPKLT